MSLRLLSRLFRSTSISQISKFTQKTATFTSSTKLGQLQHLLDEMGKRSREIEVEGKSKKLKTAEADSKGEGDAERDFASYRLSGGVVKRLLGKGISHLFPIQSATFDDIFDGKDMLARARTGTGKTMAFALPIVERLLADGTHLKRGRAPRALVMAPTRELALQVSREFETIAGNDLSVCVVYGGVGFDQQSTFFW
jgi:ATP-dependent RNA helicase DDX21